MALAIFDLDETLIHGDCATLWSAQMARLGWVDPESFMQRNDQLMEAYARGELAMEAFMARPRKCSTWSSPGSKR
jgi:phosphoserine phosphatase